MSAADRVAVRHSSETIVGDEGEGCPDEPPEKV